MQGLLRVLRDRAALQSWLFAKRWELMALAVSVATAAGYLSILMRFPHPPGSDPAQWLTGAYSYLGRGPVIPGASSYPPLYIAMLAALALLLGDPATAIWVSLAIVLFLVPLGSYAAFVLITRDRLGGLLCGIGMGVGYPLVDMVAWGGYPNLLSIPLMLLALAFLVRSSMKDPQRRDFLLLGLFTALVFLTHPISAMLFAVAALLYFLLLQAYRRDKGWVAGLLRSSLPVFAVIYLPYLAVRALSSDPSPAYFFPQPLYPVELYYYPLMPVGLRWVYPLPLDTVIISALALTLPGFLPLPYFLLKKTTPPGLGWLLGPLGRERGVRCYLLFVSTYAPPLLFPLVLMGFSLYIDYSRFLYYVQPPVVAALAAAMARGLRWRAPKHEAGDGMPSSSAPGEGSGHRGGPALASSAPGRGSRRGRVGRFAASRSGRSARIIATLGLAALAVGGSGAYSADFLWEASRYYSAFTDAADADVAVWFRGATSESAILVMSPEEENLRSVKWLEVLSQRRTLGYSPPRYLFLDEERLLNYDLYEIFNHRFGVYGGSFEFATQGSSPEGAYQFRLEIVDRLVAAPVLEVLDELSSVVYRTGSRTISDLPDRTIVPVMIDSGAPTLSALAGNTTTGGVAREAGASGREAFLRFTPAHGSTNVTGYEIAHVRAPGDFCSAGAEGRRLRLSVRVPHGCLPLEVEGRPSAAFSVDESSIRIRLVADAGGAAELTFSESSVTPGLPAGPRIYDALDLLRSRGFGYLVLLGHDSVYRRFLDAEFGFPVAYENSKYLVLSTGFGAQ